MPTIDWKYYKENVRKDYVKWVADFQKKYDAVDSLYIDRYAMLDISKYFGELSQQTEEVKAEVAKYKQESEERIKCLEYKMKYLKEMDDYNGMTMEEFCCAHPDEAPDFINKPTFWPHTEEEQKPGPVEEHHHEEEEEPPKPAPPPPPPVVEVKHEPEPPVIKEDPKPSEWVEKASALAGKGISLAVVLVSKLFSFVKGLLVNLKSKKPKELPIAKQTDKFANLDKSEDICNKTYIRGKDTAEADVKHHHTDLSHKSEGVCCEPCPKPEPKCPEPEPKCPEPEPKCEEPKPKEEDECTKDRLPTSPRCDEPKSDKCDPKASAVEVAPGTPSAPKTLGTQQQPPTMMTVAKPLEAKPEGFVMGTHEAKETEFHPDTKAKFEELVKKKAPTAVGSKLVQRLQKENIIGEKPEQSALSDVAKGMFERAIGAANLLSEAKRIIEKVQREHAGDNKALTESYESAHEKVKSALAKSYEALETARKLKTEKSSDAQQDPKVLEMIEKHKVLAKMLGSRAVTMQKAIVKFLDEAKKTKP